MTNEYFFPKDYTIKFDIFKTVENKFYLVFY